MNEMVCELIENAYEEWIAAIDSFDDAMFMHDKDYRILRCNKAYRNYAGIPFKEIIGRKYFEVFPKQEGPFPSCQKKVEHPIHERLEEELQVGEIFFRSFSYALSC